MSGFFFALVLIIGGMAFIISRQPEDFVIARSIRMAAPPAAIFPHVNDLHKWEPWSPWAKLDPTAKNSFEGPTAGVGALMRWDGNNKVGSGSMQITDSVAYERIGFKLDFLKPMKATNTAEFSFTPDKDGTLVTWSMAGKNNFIGKAMNLLLNCDKMVGTQFEKGLVSLKSIAERKA